MRSLAGALGVAGLALVIAGDGHGQTAQQPTHQAIQNQITTHDGNQTTQHNTQTTQHNSLSGQVTAHDSAQTSQHNTHDGNQTSQHNTLSQKIDDLSTSADHSGLPPTWDKTLPANDPGGTCPSTSSRFNCVMGNAAVRDNETGLVWEQSPSPTTHTWQLARFECTNRTVGGRKAWRLPSVHELASLVDPNNPGGFPDLPRHHPFTFVQDSIYWSATTSVVEPLVAWFVSFHDGDVHNEDKTLTHFVWCVRGAMQEFEY